ncbi:MAG: ATP synthase F0 subunit A [Bacteroidetes bacterium HGW-Bacteroidetes-6]|jgi:F-type H+-transporting ATPase subunit a|nr:MAG: ATP synthase F0 subunit A [Bacteroidetes bacterium HGW-Bacteroidetes-6]
MQKLLVVFSILTVISASRPVFASEEPKHEGTESEEHNPTEVIFEHILDSHEWHIISIGEKDISLPLPVILWDNGSLVVFSSSHLHHGESYNGYQIGVGEEYEGKIVHTDSNGQIDAVPLDFSITKNVVALLFSATLLLLIFIPLAKRYKKRGNQAPKGFQGFIEPVIQFVIDDIAKPNIGEKRYLRYTPYLLTVFFFIFINNVMGLIPFFPFGANITGNIAVTMTLAVFTLIIVNFSGNRNYWRHVFATPGVPFWLMPIMIPVEIIGILSKPFALMVRLFANITAGHIVVLSLVSLIFIFKTVFMSPVSIAFVLFMDVLELLVAALQAYIFTLLTALFIGMAVAEAEHH